MARVRIAALLLAAVVAAPAVAAPPPPPPPPGPPPARAPVTIAAEDGVALAGTYAANGAGPGAPAVLLVHGERTSRIAFDPMLDALDEHRVPWLAIDLRGHGGSRGEGGDLAQRIAGRDPETLAATAVDVISSVRWLVAARKHDPKRIGVLAAGLGASAAAAAAHSHKGEIAALMLMTPTTTWPGLETERDVGDTDGKMDFWILASVEDMNRLDKQGPRHLLYVVEYARNAPPHTPLDERVKRRRGIPPHLRAFAETNAADTAMITRVPHLDAWLAAFWARRFGTWPSPVLYDGSVDRKGDYEDLGWDAGVPLPAGEVTARALRWGRKVMVGGELPKGVGSILVRAHATMGDEHMHATTTSRISFPQGIVESHRIGGGPMGRAPPVTVSALVLESEELPQRDGTMLYGNPSFEAEILVPELPGPGPYSVRVSFAYTVGSGEDSVEGPGVDREQPSTWTEVPDLLSPSAPPPPPPAAPHLPKYQPGMAK